MRRGLSIARATALEIMSEPLSLLLLLSALAISTLAPAFHYHQFGEATRMARDAGFSALFLGGLLFATFGTIRTYRREIESGTAQMALAHPITRHGFFLAKALGAFAALLAFACALSANALTIVRGAAIGGEVATRTGDVARIWGPSLALGVATLVMPLALGAALNRFFRCRFVLTTFRLVLVTAAITVAYRPDAGQIVRLLPALALVTAPAVLLMTAGAAFSVRFKANAAATAAGLALAAFVPAVGNYYLPDALSNGESLPSAYAILALAALLPAIAGFLSLGVHFINQRDVT